MLHNQENTEYRKCSRCARLLPISEFYEYSSGYLDTWCKKCNSHYAKKNRNYDSIYSKYGITEEEYLRIYEIQKNKCAICGKDFSGKRLYIDHEHKTGKIRGLLCGRCNTGIGMFDDNIDNLLSAIKYLNDN